MRRVSVILSAVPQVACLYLRTSYVFENLILKAEQKDTGDQEKHDGKGNRQNIEDVMISEIGRQIIRNTGQVYDTRREQQDEESRGQEYQKQGQNVAGTKKPGKPLESREKEIDNVRFDALSVKVGKNGQGHNFKQRVQNNQNENDKKDPDRKRPRNKGLEVAVCQIENSSLVDRQIQKRYKGRVKRNGQHCFIEYLKPDQRRQIRPHPFDIASEESLHCGLPFLTED